MNAFQAIAEKNRVTYTEALDDLRASPPPDNGATIRSFEWRVSVSRGLVDDLADFVDRAAAEAFVERRRVRLAADGMRHGAAACAAFLVELRR